MRGGGYIWRGVGGVVGLVRVGEWWRCGESRREGWLVWVSRGGWVTKNIIGRCGMRARDVVERECM